MIQLKMSCFEKNEQCRKLILASKSPRRKELLQRSNVAFSVCTADVPELEKASDMRDLPRLNALRKALAVSIMNPEQMVLGADTMILFENRAIGKPRDISDAFRMLREFSGKEHEVITGVALCLNGKEKSSWSEQSRVYFKKLSDEMIEYYLSKVMVLDKAGAYAIQEHGDLIIESFSGEEENIIGLPLQKLLVFLRKNGLL